MLRKDNVKEALAAGVIGALMGFFFSFIINYFFLPVPTTAIVNALGNGTSGLISGFMGGFMGLLFYFRKTLM